MVEIFPDEDTLREEGMRDFSQYLGVPGTPEKDLLPDFFLDEFEDPGAKGSSKVSVILWRNKTKGLMMILFYE